MPCYPVPVFAATHPRQSLDSFPNVARLPHPKLLLPAPDISGSAVDGYPILLPNDHRPLITAHSCFKSFSCNTYGSLRKCCKQKTYGQAKSFRCNTYKKQGEGSRLWLTRSPKRDSCHEAYPESSSFWTPAYCMLFFRAGSNSSPGTHPASAGSHAAFDPSTKANLAITASPVKSMSGLYSSLGW